MSEAVGSDTPRGSTAARRLGCACAALAAIVALATIWLTGLGLPDTTWEVFRSAQVLAGPDELVVFAQVARLRRPSGALASGPLEKVAYRQSVVVVGKDGSVRRTETGFAPLHVNLGRVFRWKGGTCLVDSEGIVARWNGAAFEALPRQAGQELLTSEGVAWTSIPEMKQALDAITARHGWQTAFAESEFIGPEPSGGVSFSWGPRTCSWTVERSGETATAYVLIDATTKVPVLSFDPTKRREW